MNIFKKLITFFIISLFFTTASQASLVSTKEMAQHSLASKIVKNIDRKEVQQKIASSGMTTEEVKTKILALTDQEILDIQGQNQAGGEVVVISLTTLLVGIILLLLID